MREESTCQFSPSQSTYAEVEEDEDAITEVLFEEVEGASRYVYR